MDDCPFCSGSGEVTAVMPSGGLEAIGCSYCIESNYVLQIAGLKAKLAAAQPAADAMRQHVHVVQCHHCSTIRLADVECQECKRRSNEQVIASIAGQPIEIDANVKGGEIDAY